MSRSVVVVVGTRAQLIKVAPVVVECERQKLSCVLLMTGQHQETMQDLLAEFGIRSPQLPALPASEHASVGSLLRWVPVAYRGIKARMRELASLSDGLDVLVHGDTLSTVLGAFAGRRVGGRVVHLESGLTSGRLLDPFPEELSRRIVFRMTHVAMCPGPASANYMRRCHPKCEVVDTQGNTILDAVKLVGISDDMRNQSPPYLVASLHRFQNIYDSARLHELVALLEVVAGKYTVHFVLHPATRKRLQKEGLFDRLAQAPGIRMSPRLGYGAFLRLAAGASCVLTDGGSNQEELAALGVPTIVMRKATERQDGLGANVMMEGDVVGRLADYLLGGRFAGLAVSPVAVDEEGPSKRIVRYLAGVATADSSPISL